MAIKTIAIVHHSHIDLGFTDHPERALLEQIRYIDQAVDCVLASSNYPENARFAWTQEQLYPVRQWWKQAGEEQKARFFKAVQTGRLEITGSGVNVTAFMDQDEWERSLNWISPDLWDRCNIRSVMQTDINGMHTPGMVLAHRKGVRHLWIAPNYYYGMPPIPAPAAFNWQIDRDRELFVWLNPSYNNGTFMFNENWRQGPVPAYHDLRYRWPERGDIWAADEESILQAHMLCLNNIRQIEGTDDTGLAVLKTDGFTKNRCFGGYGLETLPVSVTSQWRVDNDPPFYPLVDFVKKWNEMGLSPHLTLCTATQAMETVKQEMGDDIPLYKGQWVDWWANGNASSPRELAYNREAKRTLRTAKLPLFGPMNNTHAKEADKILDNICMYDEHCFGSWESVANPYAFSSLSQTAEKNMHAYRALDGAKCLLAERARAAVESERNKIIVWNPGTKELPAVIELPRNCLRGDYQSVRCEETGAVWALEFADGAANFLRPDNPSQFGRENVTRTFSDQCKDQLVRFGPVIIPPMEKITLVPMKEAAEAKELSIHAYEIRTDENNWPVWLRFEGRKPLIDGSFGEIVSVRADGFAPRWTFKDIFETDDEDERRQLRREHLQEIEAEYGKAEVRESSGMVCYEQELSHSGLRYGKRILKIDLLDRKVNLEFHMDRLSEFEPEVIFLRFEAPEVTQLPYISNAGCMFRPEEDQFPGSCKDFYAIDGWIHYPDGWLLMCMDNALVTFGETSVMARKTETGGPPGRIYVRLVDNVWDTNFHANPCGMMCFRFAAAADVDRSEAAAVAESLSAEPVVVVKTGYR